MEEPGARKSHAGICRGGATGDRRLYSTSCDLGVGGKSLISLDRGVDFANM